jgi:hypothetical protein
MKGIYFPQMKRLLAAIKEKEELMEKYDKITREAKQNLRRFRGKEADDDDSSESDYYPH